MRVVPRRWVSLAGVTLTLAGCSADPLQLAAASLVVSPERQDIGPLPLGFVTETQVTVVNTGERPLEGQTEVVVAQRAVIDVQPQSWRLLPGNTETFIVRLNATEEGPVSATRRFHRQRRRPNRHRPNRRQRHRSRVRRHAAERGLRHRSRAKRRPAHGTGDQPAIEPSAGFVAPAR